MNESMNESMDESMNESMNGALDEHSSDVPVRANKYVIFLLNTLDLIYKLFIHDDWMRK